MYSGPNIAQPSGGAARTTLPVLGAIICGGLLLLLLAATIVLALIPIYVPQKTATLNPNSKSSLVTNYLNIDGGARRRRENDESKNLGNHVGSKFDENSHSMVKTKFKKVLLQSNKVIDILELLCVVANIDAKKRRHAFAKRQTKTVIVCSFYIQFVSSCVSNNCQTSASSICTELLVAGVTSSNFEFSGITIIKSDGSTVTITTLKFGGYAVKPDIRPGTGGAGSPVTKPTRATTVSPSPNVGG